jgi:hypothetical protein
MAAIAAAEPQVERHVAAAVVGEGLQVRGARAEAGAAAQLQVNVARLQRGPGGREVGVCLWITRHGPRPGNRYRAADRIFITNQVIMTRQPFNLVGRWLSG